MPSRPPALRLPNETAVPPDLPEEAAVAPPAQSDFLFRTVDSFLRQSHLFLLCFAVVTGVVAAALLLRAQAYTASVETQVVGESVASALSENKGGYDETAFAQYHLDRFNDLVSDDQTGGFMETALAAAHLRRPINLDPRKGDTARYKTLRTNLFTSAPSAKVFTIGLVWDDPGECERVVAALQQQYVQAVGASRQAKSAAAVAFLDGEIAADTDRLKAKEDALIDYKTKHYGELPDAQAANTHQLAELKTRQEEQSLNESASEQKAAALRAQLKDIPKVTILDQTVSDSPIALQLRALRSQKSNLRARGFAETSDAVRNVNDEIAAQSRLYAEEQIRLDAEARANPSSRVAAGKTVTQARYRPNPQYTAVAQALTDTEIALGTEKGQMAILNEQVKEFSKRVQGIPAAERKLNDRTRDAAILKAQYDSLLADREKQRLQSSLDRATAQSTLKRIGAIRAEATSSKKKSLLLLAAAVFLGLLVGAAMVLLAEWADNSLRYASDVPRLLGVPLLAAIPHQPEWADTDGTDTSRAGKKPRK